MPELPECSTADDLPNGLTMCGSPVSGGGDSMFVSIFRLLAAAQIQGIPETALALRQKLVDELLLHPLQYNFKLDRIDRKEIKLMRFQGPLLSLDLLLVASHVFKDKIFVYFWPSQPVVYQYDNFETVIHLQCISGIHFNPLIELRHYDGPGDACTVVDCSTVVPRVINNDNVDEGEEEAEVVDALVVLFADDEFVLCNHGQTVQPQVMVETMANKYCVILDTRAELSLISASLLSFLPRDLVQITNENLCSVVGLTGVSTPIMQTAVLSFNIGNYCD